MRHFKLGANSAVFFLFFLLSLFEVVRERNWLWAGIFIALGVISFRADALKR